MPEVCKIEDDFIRDKARWVVELSNGETIYQDDDRPGVEPASAWTRLSQYLRDKNVSIRIMWLQFRSNRTQIGSIYSEGYFFSNMVFALLENAGVTHGAFVAGAFDNGELWVNSYKTPELSLLHAPERREVDFASPKFISNLS